MEIKIMHLRLPDFTKKIVIDNNTSATKHKQRSPQWNHILEGDNLDAGEAIN